MDKGSRNKMNQIRHDLKDKLEYTSLDYVEEINKNEPCWGSPLIIVFEGA